MEGQHIVHTDLPVFASNRVSELAERAGCSKRVMVRALVELGLANSPQWAIEDKVQAILRERQGPLEGQLSLFEQEG